MEYRILRPLKSGGFSEVFEVEDPHSALHEVLVLKRLHPEMSARPAVRAAFAREAETLRQLTHTDLVCFRRCFYDEQGRVCLLMEKVEGETLGEWSHRRAGEAEAHLQLFDRILGAVDYLHHRPQPLVHLDLKPDNILVRETPLGPRPKLIDFGIARGLGESGLRASSEPYSAPEQHRGRALGCFTDVHALGHVLAGLLKSVEGALDPTREAALRRVTKVATKPAAKHRYADAAQMRRAFRQARAQPADVMPSPGRPWGRWAAGIALTLALLSAAGLVLTGGPAGNGAPPPAPASATTLERFRHSLEQALHSTNHAAVERHFDEARRILNAADVTPENRRLLRNALSEVRRIVNRPVVSASEREAGSRWLSEQISSVSRSEVAP